MYNKLKELCKQKGITVTQLCIQVTGNSGNLATWKKGYMRSDYLAKAADILNCSADYMLSRTENSQSTINQSVGNYSNGNNLTVNNKTKTSENASKDNITDEFIGVFKNLPFSDKLDIMNLVMEKSKNKKTSV